MDIIERIVNLANILDANKNFNEADSLTRIASKLANQRIANPVNMNQMIGNQNRNRLLFRKKIGRNFDHSKKNISI